jgi:hypothetical protein
MDLADKSNKWELAAYATGKTTYNDVPYSDDTGTYIAAQTPIYRNGKIVGLVTAEYDSATLGEFQGIVRKAFWLSVLPAILFALGLAYVLAAMFVEPMEIFRRIGARSRTGAKQSAAWCDDRSLDGVDFRHGVLPKLQGMPVRVIVEAMGASSRTARRWRGGILVRHKQHWKTWIGLHPERFSKAIPRRC